MFLPKRIRNNVFQLSFRIFKIRDNTEITRQCTRGGSSADSYLPRFTVLIK
jgi:hypothetical protein